MVSCAEQSAHFKFSFSYFEGNSKSFICTTRSVLGSPNTESCLNPYLWCRFDCENSGHSLYNWNPESWISFLFDCPKRLFIRKKNLFSFGISPKIVSALMGDTSQPQITTTTQEKDGIICANIQKTWTENAIYSGKCFALAWKLTLHLTHTYHAHALTWNKNLFSRFLINRNSLVNLEIKNSWKLLITSSHSEYKWKLVLMRAKHCLRSSQWDSWLAGADWVWMACTRLSEEWKRVVHRKGPPKYRVSTRWDAPKDCGLSGRRRQNQNPSKRPRTTQETIVTV